MNVVVAHAGQELQPTNYVWTHAGCVHNEEAALRSRHQLAAPPCERGGLLAHLADELAAEVLASGSDPWLEPISYSEVISRYTGGKKKQYIMARESLYETPLNNEDAKVRMFIKADKSHEADYKAPRAIQYRSKRYGLSWARYVISMERALYTLEDQSESPICAKGRNADQRASDLLAKAATFAQPLFMCLDHSKFDAHITPELLRIESRFYQRLFGGVHRKSVRRYMLMQMRNRGGTKNGTQYYTPGTRMSGEASTALGGTVLNILLLRAWLGAIRHCMYVDGDDSVVIIERDDRVLLPDLVTTMRAMCMHTKLEQSTEVFEEVEFCQSRPVEVGGRWRMVRNPLRVLSRAGWSVLSMPPSLVHRWVRSVGLCEMVLGRGVPILQRLGELMAQRGSGRYYVTDKHYEARKLQHGIDRVQPIDVEYATRLSFERAWGVDPQTQMLIEDTLTVEYDGQVDLYHDQAPLARIL